MRAGLGRAEARAVCSCLSHSTTAPAPSAKLTRPIIARCGHVLNLSMMTKSSLSQFHQSIRESSVTEPATIMPSASAKGVINYEAQRRVLFVGREKTSHKRHKIV